MFIAFLVFFMSVTLPEQQNPQNLRACCRKKDVDNEVNIKQDRVFCILRRASCNEQEWEDYEEKVQSEIEHSELLEDLGKVIEAAERVAQRDRNEI